MIRVLRRAPLALAFTTLLAGAALPAGAATVSWTLGTVHLRAGPGRSYPIVAILAPGTQLQVFGCIEGYRWCDVDAGMARGWVYAEHLGLNWQGADGTIVEYGPRVGIDIVVFSLPVYWDTYYPREPWYPPWRAWWPRRPPPPPAYRPPPLPPPGHVVPPPGHGNPSPPGQSARPPEPPAPHRPPDRHVPTPPSGRERQ